MIRIIYRFSLEKIAVANKIRIRICECLKSQTHQWKRLRVEKWKFIQSFLLGTLEWETFHRHFSLVKYPISVVRKIQLLLGSSEYVQVPPTPKRHCMRRQKRNKNPVKIMRFQRRQNKLHCIKLLFLFCNFQMTRSVGNPCILNLFNKSKVFSFRYDVLLAFI